MFYFMNVSVCERKRGQFCEVHPCVLFVLTLLSESVTLLVTVQAVRLSSNVSVRVHS